MAVSLYDFTVPVLTSTLTNLSKQIDKAIAYSEQKKFDNKQLAESRLIADMLPFAAQVQIVCDNAKGACRLVGIDPPKHEDSEKNLPELKARIAKTLEFLSTLKPEQFANSDTKEIVLKFPTVTFKFSGKDYVTKFLLPNFFFHATTAYALLRSNGVELGKGDFLGNIQ
jgi:uncharacterized protein